MVMVMTMSMVAMMMMISIPGPDSQTCLAPLHLSRAALPSQPSPPFELQGFHWPTAPAQSLQGGERPLDRISSSQVAQEPGKPSPVLPS